MARATTHADLPDADVAPWLPQPRIVLGLSAFLAVAAGSAWIASTSARIADPDLARVIGFMAAIKAVLAVTTVVVCGWRLARPARSWRALAYVVGPPLMLFGAMLLWTPALGVGAAGWHLGMLSVLAAALTDEEFFSLMKLRRG